MTKPVSIKPEELFAREYVDRLILEKLSEMESAVKLGELAEKLSGHGIGLATVRSLLASNEERFAYHERRWMPAARVSGAGRPIAEALRLIVDSFGAPMPLELVLSEFSRQRRVTVESVQETVRRIFERHEEFVLDGNERVSLTKWGFVAHDQKVERALALNGVELSEVEEIRKKLGNVDWRVAGSVAAAVSKLVPVSLKALGAAVWMDLSPQEKHAVLQYDARKFLAEAMSVPHVVLAADGVLYPEAESKKWVTTAIKLAERIAPLVDVEDAAPIEVKTDDVKRLVDRITSTDQTVTATKLLEDFFEITPSNKTFPDDLTNLMTSLKGQSQVVWVGADRYRKAGTLPDFIEEVPEPFRFVATQNEDSSGDLIDVELTDDGLSSTLRKLLGHPLATDVLDEDPLPAPKVMPESLRLVLKGIHRELGTFPLCQIPTGWIDPQPKIQEIILIDPQGRELQGWLNHEARLIYNLIDWWFEQSIESGGVFTLTKTARPNVFDFQWLDQPDPVVYISAQRMEELRKIGEASEGRSTLDILIDVMGHWPKGADYLTLLAEVNVVRRSTRRLIASLLSSYQCFFQRSGSPVWHYDAKKLELGFDKAKKKFIKK